MDAQQATVFLDNDPYQFGTSCCMVVSYAFPALRDIIQDHAITHEKDRSCCITPAQIQMAVAPQKNLYIRLSMRRFASIMDTLNAIEVAKEQSYKELENTEEIIEWLNKKRDRDEEDQRYLQLSQELRGVLEQIIQKLSEAEQQSLNLGAQLENLLNESAETWEDHTELWDRKLLAVLKDLGLSVDGPLEQELHQLDTLAKIKERFRELNLDGVEAYVE